MAVRLLIVAHGRTLGSQSDPVFGEAGSLQDARAVVALDGRIRTWATGPEPACLQTTEALGGSPQILAALAAPDLGRWTGTPLSDVAATDGEALRHWLSDPAAAPHGGESLSEATARIGTVCDRADWPPGRSVVVVTPMVATLIAAHALGGDVSLAFRIDVPPGGRFEISAGHGGWRLVLR